MVSDDAEHACMVAQSLLQYPRDPKAFARSLAWKLRFWMMGLPAGVGKATALATLKLCLGVPPHRSGVNSAGNGPAMRSAILGICLRDDPEQLREFVRVSSRLTHTDPRAERGALLVAHAARYASQGEAMSHDPSAFFENLPPELSEGDEELCTILGIVKECLRFQRTPGDFVHESGWTRGVTGYIYHTVPAALFCWLRYPGDFRLALEQAIALGGDTDTVGAIVGAIVGASVGAEGIPTEWLNGLVEWPRSKTWMRTVASTLAGYFAANGADQMSQPVPWFWPGQIPRNLVFLTIVLGHGFRRLLPPY